MSDRSTTGRRAALSSSSVLNASNVASSRPFLNMLNPMGRKYQGYVRADQLREEDEEDEDTDSHIAGSHQGASPRQHSRRVSWGANNSEMNMLRPNVHQDDRNRDEQDDEVPQSFMIEATTSPSPRPARTKKRKPQTATATPPNISNPAELAVPPRPSELDVGELPQPVSQPVKPLRGLDEYERALWNWVNVYNLDAFLQEVYYYYEGNGIYCIALSRGLNLLTVGFVIGFSTFLLGCVDYSRIRPEGITRLSDVVVGRCISRFSGFTFLFFLLFSAFYVWQIVTFALGMRRLLDMYRFYTHLLRIPDEDIQTISWSEVVRRIAAIREDNPITALSSARNATATKLDAHDIANRIMRQENYLIALFNKDVLDLRTPLPPSLNRFIAPEEGKGRILTRTLEWNLRFCLMEYLFDPSGKVRKVFLKSKNRAVLIEGLKRRLIFMGILNAIFAPFIVLYLVMYSFFRYFEEYHKNPSSIGGRHYTPFAKWKFREFNELPHFFTRRLDESYPTATVYIAQFPNEKIALIMRFVSFVAGSFAAVLLLASVVDPDLFVHFEVTPHRTVLFYIGVFGSILAVARGMVPEDHRVFDTEMLMTDVIQYTHYMPDAWKDQLHSKKVHQEFGQLFAMRIMTYLQELVSVIMTPFVLWFSLPQCAPAIIDFFREFSVHVDGLGYVCSFAVFDFQRHGNVKFGAPTTANDERLMSKEGKMEKSFLNFKAAHPHWNPSDPNGSLYLSRMADYNAANPVTPSRRARNQNTILESTDLSGTVLLSDQKAQEYDRALKQSQLAAAARQKRGMGSTMLGGGTVGGLSASVSQAGGMAMAQTVALGDSQADLGPPAIMSPPVNGEAAIRTDESEELHEPGYIDGKQPALYGGVSQSQQEEDEELEDGGVLGLLAQIYGTRGHGPARVI